MVRCWCGYLSGARCRLAHAQLMPLPLTISCSNKIQIGFTFLVPAHPGSPGQRAVKRVCVFSKNDRLFEVRRPTGSHVHPKSGSIKEMARDRLGMLTRLGSLESQSFFSIPGKGGSIVSQLIVSCRSTLAISRSLVALRRPWPAYQMHRRGVSKW